MRQVEGMGIQVICVDIMTKEDLASKYEPQELQLFAQDNTHHLQRDLHKLTIDKINMWCKMLAGGTVRDIIAIHASFTCTTLSRAGACTHGQGDAHISRWNYLTGSST